MKIANEAHVPTIKARAWDSKLKKFIYHELVDGQVGVSITSDDNTPLHLFKHLSNWMPYTGQHSIDNVEIYVGDLLQFPDLNETYEVRWYSPERTWSLFFCGGMTRLGKDSPYLLWRYPLSEASSMHIFSSSHETPLVSSVMDKATTTNTKARGHA